MKVMTILGTRPEIIRLSATIKVLDEHFEHVLVHTGQNYDYELNEIFFDELGIRKPDFFLHAGGAGPIQTVAAILVSVDQLLREQKPEAVLVLGDTNSSLSVYAAKRRHIPIFHMEAGNRSFDFRVPEEINRRVVDHLSDVNLTYSEHARRYLEAEGFAPDRIMKVGSPLYEVVQSFRGAALKSTVVRDLGLESNRFILLSAHREENVDKPARLARLFDCIEALATDLDADILMSMHPRTAKRVEEGGLSAHPRLRLMKPFGYVDYLALQMAAMCVVSDSGTITEEASILRIPAVTIRQAHERPEGMDEGTLIMTDLNPERVVSAVRMSVAQNKVLPPEAVRDYEAPSVSWKIAKIIASYTDFVRREVWKDASAADKCA